MKTGHLTCAKCQSKAIVGSDYRFYCSNDQCRLHERNIDIPTLEWFKIEDEMLHGKY